ncbi:MAG: hypothetical protein AAF333_10630 [Planctomycetota bacterium]
MPLDITNAPDARATLFGQTEYQLIWRPSRAYPAGTEIELRSDIFRSYVMWRIVRVSVDYGEVTFRMKQLPTHQDRGDHPDEYRRHVILQARITRELPAGEPVTLKVVAIPTPFACLQNEVSLWCQEPHPRSTAADPRARRAYDDTWTMDPGAQNTLAVTAGSVERVSVISRPAAGPDGKVRTLVVPEDRYGNPSRFTQPVEATLTWAEQSHPLTLEELTELQLDAPTKIERAILTIAADQLDPNDNLTNADFKGDQLVVTGNPVWRIEPGQPRPAFGEIHWHSILSSDGYRDYEDALRAARDEMNFDFISSGDHNPGGEKWDTTVRGLEAFNDPGRFATFFGYEDSSWRGHQNYYFTDPNHPVRPGGEAGLEYGGGPLDNNPKLDAYPDVLTIPHHTNSVAETRDPTTDLPLWHAYPWGEPAETIRLVEVFQARGNQEADFLSDRWRGWHQHHGASVRDALARGHQIGFTGGSDNHNGLPSRAWAGSEVNQFLANADAGNQSLTGVWCDKFDRQSVFDALYARHTWAVWDTRAIALFRLNGAMMGDELHVSPGTELTATLKLSCDGPLQSLEVISDGQTVWSTTTHERDLDLTISLGVATTSTYFYTRALQRDGAMIYTSPVFVRVP